MEWIFTIKLYQIMMMMIEGLLMGQILETEM